MRLILPARLVPRDVKVTRLPGSHEFLVKVVLEIYGQHFRAENGTVFLLGVNHNFTLAVPGEEEVCITLKSREEAMNILKEVSW